MIEIAISLAVIGFALVAIIGILPTGMNVQKLNRQETIINQDASVFLNAIRNGERNVDDLTNYVMAITNYVTFYDIRGQPAGRNVYGYTYTTSSQNGARMTPPFPITNGFRIVGLLSTPQIAGSGDFASNHVVAFVRSMSGPASEKYPQSNPAVQDLGLSYRFICDVIPYGTNFFNPAWTNWRDRRIAGDADEIARRRSYAALVTNYQANFHELRLTFRWPLLPNGSVSDSSPRQVFRTAVSGALIGTNEVRYPYLQPYILYFFQPRTYVSK